MSTTLDIHTSLSESDLQEAEKSLLSMAAAIDRITGIKEPNVRNQLRMISEQLRLDNADLRKDVGASIRKHSRHLSRLIDDTNRMHQENLDSVRELLGDSEKTKVSLNEVNRWKTDWDKEHDRRLTSLQAKKTALHEELSEKNEEKKQLKERLAEQEAYISDLTQIDKSLKAPDNTIELHQETKQLEVKLKQLLHRASIVSETNIGEPEDMTRFIHTLRSELEAEHQHLIETGDQLPESMLVHDKTAKARKRKQKAKEIREFDKLIEDIRRGLQQKNGLLDNISGIEEEYESTRKQLKRQQLLLAGEKERVGKQRKRAEWMKHNSEIKSDIENAIIDLERKIEGIRADMKACDDEREAELNQKRRIEQRIVTLKETARKINDNVVQIRKLEKREKTTKSPKELWIENLQLRIKTARKGINLGMPLAVLFLPRRAYARYWAGTYIRRDLILLEKEYRQLGLLNNAYLERCDIFHRKTRNGLQLSLEVLNCG